MQTWFDVQKEHLDRLAQKREAAAQAREDKAQLRATPLRLRIQKIVRDMPARERGRPQPIQYFVDQLAPRWNGSRAAARDVARGLRELGWTRRRHWQGEVEGFTTYWFPPAQ
jgi:hypothetical protein